MKVEVDADELAGLRAEKARLERKVTELVDNASLVVEAARRDREEVRKLEMVANALGQHHARTWQDDVREFFLIAEQEVPSPFVPADPTEASLRLGAKIAIEEVLETFEALFDDETNERGPDYCGQLRLAKNALAIVWRYGTPRVNMPEAADGIVDSIYVLLGLAVRLGVDISPLWREVHRKNLLKQGGPKDEDGKKLKPEGWTPPDVAKLLREQGWQGVQEAT